MNLMYASRALKVIWNAWERYGEIVGAQKKQRLTEFNVLLPKP